MRTSDSPTIRKASVALLLLTLLAGTVIIDGACAQYYFYSNWIRLENAASSAATAASCYLPSNPAMALKVAHKYASLNGIRPSEIVSTTIAPDDSTITIRLARKMPFYLNGVGIGSSGPVTATDIARATRTPPMPANSRSYDL